MTKWGCAMLMATAACLGAPAAHAADGEITVGDKCGDNRAGWTVDGERQDLPETERRAGFDVKQFSLSQTTTGVRATLTMCGAIADSAGLSGWRSARAMLTDDCGLTLAVEEGVAPGRAARFIKTCWNGPEKSPIAPFASDTSDTRFDITLPASAYAVNGATLTIDVARAGLTGEAAEALAPGTTWKQANAATVEGATLSGVGVYGDSEGGYHSWSWAAPFNYDWSESAGSLTLS